MSDSLLFQYLACLSNRVDSLASKVREFQIEDVKIRDVASQLDLANKRLEELVMTDPLTGIGNRRMFMGRLTDKIADARRGAPLSLLMIDVDHFKQYNDTHGHLAGDHALKTLASELQSNVRQTDCFARFGGEEFVLASSINTDGAMVLADKLRSKVENMDVDPEKLTISIGLSSFSRDDDDCKLIAKADLALYDAKRHGRNRVSSFCV